MINTNVILQNLGSGSGFSGSITAKDLSMAGPMTAAAPGVAVASGVGSSSVDIPISGVRGVIAKRLLQSKQVLTCYEKIINTNECP